MKRAARILKYIGIAILVVALGAYWDINTKVLVINGSSQTLTEVTISLVEGGEIPDVVLWKGGIAPGSVGGYWGLAPDDGSLIVSVATSGGTSQTDLGYVSGPISTSALVRVRSEDNIKVTQLVPLWFFVMAGIVVLLTPIRWMFEAIDSLMS